MNGVKASTSCWLSNVRPLRGGYRGVSCNVSGSVGSRSRQPSRHQSVVVDFERPLTPASRRKLVGHPCAHCCCCGCWYVLQSCWCQSNLAQQPSSKQGGIHFRTRLQGTKERARFIPYISSRRASRFNQKNGCGIFSANERKPTSHCRQFTDTCPVPKFACMYSRSSKIRMPNVPD